MHIMYICVHCSDKHSEINPHEPENSAQVVKDLANQVLRDHCKTVIVDEVVIDLSLASPQQRYTIHIHARCPDRSLSLLPQQLKHIELKIEASISCKLMQLVGTMDVKCVTITFPPYE